MHTWWGSSAPTNVCIHASLYQYIDLYLLCSTSSFLGMLLCINTWGLYLIPASLSSFRMLLCINTWTSTFCWLPSLYQYMDSYLFFSFPWLLWDAPLYQYTDSYLFLASRYIPGCRCFFCINTLTLYLLLRHFLGSIHLFISFRRSEASPHILFQAVPLVRDPKLKYKSPSTVHHLFSQC